MGSQQSGPVKPQEAPLEWNPPVGHPPVFAGGVNASTSPWRASFFEHTSQPVSEAGPAPSRYGTPPSSASQADGSDP
eukprot:13831446-Alexandrium_andersonii.AAC.1